MLARFIIGLISAIVSGYCLIQYQRGIWWIVLGVLFAVVALFTWGIGEAVGDIAEGIGDAID